MSLKILVDSEEFWRHLQADIAAAKKSVYIQAMTFDADKSGRQVAEALIRAKAQDRRALVDTVSQYIVSDRFVYAPRYCLDQNLRQECRDTRRMVVELEHQGVRVRMTNPYGPLWLRFLARNHKKLVVIDGEVAYIGGINFSDHNFSWHDMMLRIEDREVAAFLEKDFLSTWKGRDQFTSKSFKNMEIWIGDGRSNPKMFNTIFEIIRRAKKDIFIESTYFALPFFDMFRAIGSPRPRITLLTSAINNWTPMRNYIPWEARRSGIKLRLYPGRLTHLKAALADDQHLIMGSSNFEFFSYTLYQEIVAIIHDPGVIADFREKVMIPDLEKSISHEGAIRPLRAYVRSLQFRLLAKLSRKLTFL